MKEHVWHCRSPNLEQVRTCDLSTQFGREGHDDRGGSFFGYKNSCTKLTFLSSSPDKYNVYHSFFRASES